MRDSKIKRQNCCIDCGIKICSLKALRCKPCQTTHMWKDKDFREKRVKASLNGLKKRINKAEQKLYNVLTALFQNKYKFVGDGKVILDGFCPDFY